MRIDTNTTNKGFTLIEMIVAVGVFTVAVLISVGAILSISAVQKRAIAIQNVQDNIRFTLETMSKEARTGFAFHCGADINDISTAPRDCDKYPGGPSFTFINARNETVTYRIVGGQIERSSDAGANFFPITSQDITVDELHFYVIGSQANKDDQPRVTITVRGRATVKSQVILLNLQTTMSQRLLDS